MSYINNDFPYDKYVEKRHMGRAAIPAKWYETFKWNKSLTVRTVFMISPKIKKGIDKLVENEIFPNKAEFFRYLIIRFFEEHKEWLK